jgi:hypothetical protein
VVKVGFEGIIVALFSVVLLQANANRIPKAKITLFIVYVLIYPLGVC